MNETIHVNGSKIALETAGSRNNPPILFIHGLMSHRGVWARTIERLQDRYYCVALDLLGFSDSDKPRDGDYSIAAQAERALNVADHFGLQKFILAGHSMGGQISLHLAAAHPQRVSKLILVSAVVTGKLSPYVRIVTMSLVRVGRFIPKVYDLFQSFGRSQAFSNWAFAVWFYDPPSLDFDSWKIDREKAITPLVAVSTYEAYRAMRRANLTTRLSEINVPALAIHGRHDATVPLTDALELQRKLRDSNVTIIEGCGHFPMYEKFDVYIASLKGFLGT